MGIRSTHHGFQKKADCCGGIFREAPLLISERLILEQAMAGYGYATPTVHDGSRRSPTPSDAARDHWVLTKFSRVLALALGKKAWRKPVQPPVPFGDVIERVRRAQAEHDEERTADQQFSDDAGR